MSRAPTVSSRISFGDSFQTDRDVRRYEEDVYHADGYDSFIWALQRPVLIEQARQLRAVRGHVSYLDFACGTGRIVSEMESWTDVSVAIDISSTMIEMARRKVKRTELLVGDPLCDRSLIRGSFDLVTAFRFFLNADISWRLQAMRTLAASLAGPDSLLIFNVHGNRNSIRHLGVARRRRRGELHNEMTPHEIKTAARQAGLRIERVYGYGLTPRALHKGFLRPLMRGIDACASGQGVLANISQDLLVVCRRS